jgi:hypothetical protein
VVDDGTSLMGVDDGKWPPGFQIMMSKKWEIFFSKMTMTDGRIIDARLFFTR